MQTMTAVEVLALVLAVVGGLQSVLSFVVSRLFHSHIYDSCCRRPVTPSGHHDMDHPATAPPQAHGPDGVHVDVAGSGHKAV